MATKAGGSLGDDTAKSTGSLEKDPLAGVDTDTADAGGYDYSDYGGSSHGGSAEPSTSGGASSSDSGEGATDDDPGGGDPGSDDARGNDTGADDSAGDSGGEPPTEAETLPGELPPDTADPGESDRRVAIDIDLMIVLIAAMERARDRIPELAHELRTILSDLDLDVSDAAGAERATAWIEDELPMLRRRLALAEALEDGRPIPGPHPYPTPGPAPLPGPVPLPAPRRSGPDVIQPLPGRREVVWDGDLIVAVPPHEAAESGRRAAMLIGQADDASASEAAELIGAHQADPYFAREFASNTDPSFIPNAVTAAAGTGLEALVTATIATATRATGELALDDSTREAWASAPA